MIRKYAPIIIILILCLIICNSFQLIYASGPSMEPTCVAGDVLIVTRWYGTPKVGDIVLIQTDQKLVIKRIAAIEGQIAQDTQSISYSYWSQQEDAAVPSNYVFVLGDNPDHSRDSRDENFGLVHVDQVIGKVIYIWKGA